MLVVRGGCGASQVVDLVAFDFELVEYIMLKEGKVGVAYPLLNVLSLAREEVVHDDDDVALLHQGIDEVAADKTCAASHKNPPLNTLLSYHLLLQSDTRKGTAGGEDDAHARRERRKYNDSSNVAGISHICKHSQRA